MDDKETGEEIHLNAANNWQATLTDLPANHTYSVKEIAVKNYLSSQVAKEVSEDGRAITCTVTNTFAPELPESMGNLTITKTVIGEGATDTHRNQEFAFMITLLDDKGEPLTESFAYTGNKNGKIKNGGIITLKHGESVTINDLPEGTVYIVKEEQTEQTRIDVSYSCERNSQGERIIAADVTDTIAFTNYYRPQTPPDDPNTPPEGPNTPSDEPNTPPDAPDIPSDEPTIPAIPNLPDANDPNSPDEITIFDNDTPTTYVRVQDPNGEELIYVPEDEVPLATVALDNTPATGDNSPKKVWALLCLLSLCGIVGLKQRKTEHRK